MSQAPLGRLIYEADDLSTASSFSSFSFLRYYSYKSKQKLRETAVSSPE